MRIGIDCRTILDANAPAGGGGVAHYTYYLVKTLPEIDRRNEYVLFFNEGSSSSPIYRPINGRATVTFFRYSQYKHFLPYVYSHILIANHIKKAKLDVFHSPANIVPLKLLGDRDRPRLVTTIHDLAIYRNPEWFPPRQGFSIKYLVPKTIKHVDHIIVPSQATKNDVMELFGVGEQKITVIPHGVDTRFFRQPVIPAKAGIQGMDPRVKPEDDKNGKYILFVGTLEPRKNLVRLIEAYANLPKDIIEEYSLVIAGAKGWKYQDIFLKIENCKLEIRDKINILDYYPDKKLPQLMANAAVFVYPSLYEGFGLPVLEAMAAGVPVVTSKGSAMEEVAGGVAELVDPYSVEEIKSAMVKMLKPLPPSTSLGSPLSSSGEGSKVASRNSRDIAYSSQISKLAQERARQFTWERAAKQTLAVYQALST